MFPFLSAGDDENKLLAKTAVIQVIHDWQSYRTVQHANYMLNIVPWSLLLSLFTNCHAVQFNTWPCDDAILCSEMLGCNIPCYTTPCHHKCCRKYYRYPYHNQALTLYLFHCFYYPTCPHIDCLHLNTACHHCPAPQGVTKATTAWVEDFVLKYKLCPFAEHVFVTGGIRYRWGGAYVRHNMEYSVEEYESRTACLSEYESISKFRMCWYATTVMVSCCLPIRSLTEHTQCTADSSSCCYVFSTDHIWCSIIMLLEAESNCLNWSVLYNTDQYIIELTETKVSYTVLHSTHPNTLIHRVFLGTDRKKIIERLRYEVLFCSRPLITSFLLFFSPDLLSFQIFFHISPDHPHLFPFLFSTSLLMSLVLHLFTFIFFPLLLLSYHTLQ